MSTNATMNPLPESVRAIGAIQVLVSENIPFITFVKALSMAGLELRFDGVAGELRISSSPRSAHAAKRIVKRRPPRRSAGPTAKRARAPRVAASTAH